MNGFFLFLPLLFIRFGLLGILDPQALKRAAHFAPVEGKERLAYSFYQLANLGIFIYPFFISVSTVPICFWVGLGIYIFGIMLCLVSTVDFAKSNESGLNQNGIYRFSRNPMYLSYFFYFLGCVLMTQSWILLLILLVFQVSAHWIILSEERWCLNHFGQSYKNYLKEARRYF